MKTIIQNKNKKKMKKEKEEILCKLKLFTLKRKFIWKTSELSLVNHKPFCRSLSKVWTVIIYKDNMCWCQYWIFTNILLIFINRFAFHLFFFILIFFLHLIKKKKKGNGFRINKKRGGERNRKGEEGTVRREETLSLILRFFYFFFLLPLQPSLVSP